MEMLLKINSNEDLDMIEDFEEREEAQEQYEDEIEKVYCYLHSEKEYYDEKYKIHYDEVLFIDQIDDYRINISINLSKLDSQKIIEELEKNIDTILEKHDVAYAIWEDYEEA